MEAMKAALVVAVVVAFGGAACSRAPQRDPWAAEAAVEHQRADVLIEAGDTAGARLALRTVVESGAAAGAATEGERFAMQDTYFRLARLAMDAREPKEALADAQAGLAYGEAPHLFVANLLVARAAAREATGDPRGAAEDYHRALLMNETLLERTLQK
jgi:hypothetical protein